jgi:hypothetical protein
MAAMRGVAFLALLGLTVAGTAHAGGSSDVGSSDADDPRTTVFGFVKDTNGNPVDDAKVTITMKLLNTDLVVHSDPQGHFSAKLFYNPVAPKDIGLACAKDAYHQMAVVPRPPLGAAAPIEFDCVLDKN